MDTLVLSTAFEPMRKVSWQDAMSMWVAGKVEIVSEYSDRFIRTAKKTFNVPSVVRFVKNVFKRWSRPVKFSKHNIYIRDNGKCQYCSKKVSVKQATFDHVMPKAQGGKTSWKNIVISCFECNQIKRNQTPEQAKRNRTKEQKKRKLFEKPINPTKPKSLTVKDSFQVNGEIPDDWKMWLGM